MTDHAELLDTSVVAPRDRQEYWSTGIAERFFPMRVDTVLAPTFDARLVGGRIGPVAVGSIQGRPHRVVRTSAQIAAGDPECILLYLLTRGAVRIEQEDRSCLLRPGDLACHDTSRPSVFEGPENFEVLLFSVPRWFIGPRSENIARRTATRASAGAPLARLAAPFLASLFRAAANGDGLPGNDGHGAAEMILPVLRTAFGDDALSTGDTAVSPLLIRLQRYATEHLHESDLGPERLANEHFVSTRYVHKLFAASGSGVSEWIRDRRLEGAREELRKPGTAIAAVAERWGYRNPASFSRAYRERYGCAPSDVRRARAST
jgi:AraC-like DNA-binding protein